MYYISLYQTKLNKHLCSFIYLENIQSAHRPNHRKQAISISSFNPRGCSVSVTWCDSHLSWPGIPRGRQPHGESPHHQLLAHTVGHAQMQHPPLPKRCLRGLQKVGRPRLGLAKICKLRNWCLDQNVLHSEFYLNGSLNQTTLLECVSVSSSPVSIWPKTAAENSHSSTTWAQPTSMPPSTDPSRR